MHSSSERRRGYLTSFRTRSHSTIVLDVVGWPERRGPSSVDSAALTGTQLSLNKFRDIQKSLTVWRWVRCLIGRETVHLEARTEVNGNRNFAAYLPACHRS